MNQDWNEVEALRESLREHMVEIHRLRAAGRQALDALEEYQEKGAPFMSCNAAVATLRAALADEAMQRLTDVQQEIEATSQQSQQVEPVAYMMVNDAHSLVPSLHFKAPTDWHITWEAIPLYTTPPKRKPLTEESLENLFLGNDSNDWWRLELKEFVNVARAIERAHDIGGEK